MLAPILGKGFGFVTPSSWGTISVHGTPGNWGRQAESGQLSLLGYSKQYLVLHTI